MIKQSWTVAIASIVLVGTVCATSQTWADQADKPGRNARAEGREKPQPETAEGAVVILTPDRKRFQVGDTVIVKLQISKAGDVGHVPFHLSFDPTVLRFERGVEGDVLNGDGKPTAFAAAATTAGDTVVVGLSRLGRVAGVEGEGHLCTLEFTAIGSGNANFGFARATVRNATNKIIPAAFRPARLVVY